MSTAEVTGAFYIDGGPPHPGTLTITQDVQRVASLSPRPSKTWSFRDAAGHFHAYSVEGKRYPTLQEVDHPCDSPHLDDAWWCECFTDYRCIICREVIVPGMDPGPHEDLYPGLRDWNVTLLCDGDCPKPEVGAMVTVEATLSTANHFGVAVVSGLEVWSPVASQERTRITLIGAGPLGERKGR